MRRCEEVSGELVVSGGDAAPVLAGRPARDARPSRRRSSAQVASSGRRRARLAPCGAASLPPRPPRRWWRPSRRCSMATGAACLVPSQVLPWSGALRSGASERLRPVDRCCAGRQLTVATDDLGLDTHPGIADVMENVVLALKQGAAIVSGTQLGEAGVDRSSDALDYTGGAVAGEHGDRGRVEGGHGGLLCFGGRWRPRCPPLSLIHRGTLVIAVAANVFKPPRPSPVTARK